MPFLAPLQLAVLLLLGFHLSAQTIVQFSLDYEGKQPIVGIRGDTPPLSWEKTLPLEQLSKTVIFPDARNGEILEYKYVTEDKKGQVTWELETTENRMLVFTDASLQQQDRWDVLLPFPVAELPLISTSELQEDFAILKEAFLLVHPGLYRYNSEAKMNSHFDALEADLQRDLTIAEAYLAFSKFAASIQCGHTYCNFFNQSPLVKRVILDQADKVPFAFQLVEKRMLVTKDASPEKQLPLGTEILSINSIPVATILDSLMTVVKADGNNDAKRLNDLQLTGWDTYEAFDVYFPLFFPPVDGSFEIEAKNLKTDQSFRYTVAATTRQERLKELERRGMMPVESVDDLWQFRLLDSDIGYLQLGTFVTMQLEMDWKAFLKDAFATLKKKNIRHLIIDIRGNEGGVDEAVQELSTYLVVEDMQIPSYQSRVRYTTIPQHLRQYLSTWDNSVFDLTGKVKPLDNGFFVPKDAADAVLELKGSKKAFDGQVYLLVNASNSSGTFYLADMAQKGKLATIVGEPTGGSKRGLNAGMLFFLKLPNSQIEIDLPIIGNFPQTEQPAEGVQPDYIISPTVEDVVNGVDTQLEFVQQLIRKQKF